MDSNKKIDEGEKISVDKKLSELMLRGWAMVANTCPIEHCRCPLMRDPEQNKYCCNCETWITDNGPVKKIFGELICINNKAFQQVKHKEIIPIPKKQHIETESVSERKIESQSENHFYSVLQIHEKKLKYLSERLSTETDLRTMKVLLKDINLCIKNIKELKTLK